MEHPRLAELGEAKLNVVKDFRDGGLDQAHEVRVGGLHVLDDEAEASPLFVLEDAGDDDLEGVGREGSARAEDPVLTEQRLSKQERLAAVREDINLEREEEADGVLDADLRALL